MKRLITLLSIILALSVISCSSGGVDKAEMKKKAQNFFEPLADKMPGSENDTAERIALGKKLYFEKRLSSDDQISCNTCHLLDPGKGGVDYLPVSLGVGNKKGTRNSPTVLNAGFHIAQFWDGRAADLKEQAGGPVLNPVEMLMADSASVEKKIGAIEEYKTDFAAAFPGEKQPITYNNITEAIAAFERTLITHDRFDKFLKGDMDALSNEEVEGLGLFMDKGCTTCHIGPLLGGNMYQKSGLVHPYDNQEDTGKFQVTNKEEDKYFFKVPSLRNIELTAPYFHDGKVETLEQAVKNMAWMQLNKELTDAEIAKIVVFLNSLSDEEITAN